jgi:hypothetical protein
MEQDKYFIEKEFGLDSYYTKPEVLKHIASVVAPLLQKLGGDLVFVDFACGDNSFCPLLNCKTISYDIASIATRNGGIMRDWLTVDELPEKLVIGLNPPFGYQGSVAKKFIEHALKFKPVYMFLILPNIRWKPQNYILVHQEPLADNSFYDPITKKTFREISTTFNIFEYTSDIKLVTNITALPEILTGVEITRKWTKRYPYVILRRVGRNTTKQFYCGVSDDEHCYIEKSVVFMAKTWEQTEHSIKTDYFLKVYFNESVSLQKLIELCNLIYNFPEEGYDTKQPHAITNGYVKRMILQWKSAQ